MNQTVFSSGVGEQTQDLIYTRQVLYHQTTPPAQEPKTVNQTSCFIDEEMVGFSSDDLLKVTGSFLMADGKLEMKRISWHSLILSIFIVPNTVLGIKDTDPR